jgi:hypothetical protein
MVTRQTGQMSSAQKLSFISFSLMSHQIDELYKENKEGSHWPYLSICFSLFLELAQFSLALKLTGL